MWIGKNAKPSPAGSKPIAMPVTNARVQAAPAEKEIHVAHIVETLVSDFLIKHGRLEKRNSGRHLVHFIGARHNPDGSTDYTVRTRLHTQNGLQRNFESQVRIDSSGALSLLR